MISTKDLRELPDILSFTKLMQSLAMLDAILSPEWEYRYYTFDSAWSHREMMASMRNGLGDHWHAIICPAGVALQGLAHEAPNYRPGKPWEGIFEGLPAVFHENLLREPAFTTEDSTFCIWRLANDKRWSCGPVQLPPGHDPDGSEELLGILAGTPEQYVEFAADYYDCDLSVRDVKAVYQHRPLTNSLVRRLNPDVDLDSIDDDIMEIGYAE